MKPGVTLTEATRRWPSPTARDLKGRNQRDTDDCLPGAAKQWPTPNAERVANRTDVRLSGDGRTTPNKLGWAASRWTTPAASVVQDTEPIESWQARKQALDVANGGSTLGTPLTIAARSWVTPQAGDADRGPDRQRATRPNSGGDDLTSQIAAWSSSPPASGRPDPTTPTAGPGSSPPTVLSPPFVEWLMGWPIGWTDSTRSATASFRSWRRMHSSVLRAALSTTPDPC